MRYTEWFVIIQQRVQVRNAEAGEDNLCVSINSLAGRMEKYRYDSGHLGVPVEPQPLYQQKDC